MLSKLMEEVTEFAEPSGIVKIKSSKNVVPLAALANVLPYVSVVGRGPTVRLVIVSAKAFTLEIQNTAARMVLLNNFIFYSPI